MNLTETIVPPGRAVWDFGDSTAISLGSYEFGEWSSPGKEPDQPADQSLLSSLALTSEGIASDRCLSGSLMSDAFAVSETRDSAIDLTPLLVLDPSALTAQGRALVDLLIDYFSEPDDMGDEWWDELEAQMKRDRLRFREFEL